MRYLLAAAALAAGPAAAAVTTVDLSPSAGGYTFASYDAAGNAIANNIALSGNTVTNDDVAFWTATTTITVPKNLVSATANVNGLTSDDRTVLTVNGRDFGVGAGIFGPGTGSFIFTPGGAATPYTFAANGSDFTLTGFAPAGAYTVTFIVNNTNNGINGTTLTGGPSSLTFTADAVFTTGAVPEAATWSMMIAGFGLVGFAARRRNTLAA